jgi:hypothetical protein
LMTMSPLGDFGRMSVFMHDELVWERKFRKADFRSGSVTDKKNDLSAFIGH